MPTALITGSAGFIGYHLAKELLREGYDVFGYDGMTDYYDVGLKRRRHQMLLQSRNFSCEEGLLEDTERLSDYTNAVSPDVVVHLAAQAGVRYSLENPRAYVDSNMVGTFNLLEALRGTPVTHLLMASTSSVYGGNEAMPFRETDNVASPLTLYAATKIANESMGHSFAHLSNVPVTMFRFFTVYGPWGRPDLALFKFVRAALKDEAIDVYNNGNMARDFTYVSDLVRAIRLLIDVPPSLPDQRVKEHPADSLSLVAPFRVVNIGNGKKIPLMDFIREIETCLGKTIRKNFLEMQTGDVPATHASNALLSELTGYRPKTDISEGISEFVDWYRIHYA